MEYLAASDWNRRQKAKAMSNRLGRVIRQRRIARLLTLQELASASGVSIAELITIETDSYTPTNDTVHKIAQALSLNERRWLSLAGENLDQLIVPPANAAPTTNLAPALALPTNNPRNAIKVAYRSYTLA